MEEFLGCSSEVNDSWMWKVFLGLRVKIRPFIVHKIGNGKDVYDGTINGMLYILIMSKRSL